MVYRIKKLLLNRRVEAASSGSGYFGLEIQKHVKNENFTIKKYQKISVQLGQPGYPLNTGCAPMTATYNGLLLHGHNTKIYHIPRSSHGVKYRLMTGRGTRHKIPQEIILVQLTTPTIITYPPHLLP